MDSFLIRGGRPLHGTIDISGSKNAALPLLAACLMADGPTTLLAVPRLSDIRSMCRLLETLGCSVRRAEPNPADYSGPVLNGPLTVEVQDTSASIAGYDLVKEMRASICVLGPLLGRRGKAVISLPGGCAIGDRPIDLHLRGLEKLGARFRQDKGNIIADIPGGRLKGTTIYLGGAQGPTVLGTINVMCAAVLAEGVTTIVSAACEPEVADVAKMLNRMGARIQNAGSPEIRIEGVPHLHGVEHRVIPDRIEAGTFVMAAAATRGHLTLRHAQPHNLLATNYLLDEMGVKTSILGDTITIDGEHSTLREIETTTQPYPGFPTDLQAQLMSLACLGDGMSVITERIFPERFTHVAELNRMGARIRKEGASCFIKGVGKLSGARVMCTDLRASAALVIAGLAATGTTVLDRVYHIDRGYEQIEAKLAAVGASIERMEESRTAATLAA